jgi:curved DNA-binding protein CbpA
MKLDSSYFDKIRIGAEVRREPSARPCDMRGCAEGATHRAPKGRLAEGEYFWFCLDHVREYNKSYNYFSGMNDSAIQAYQREALVGHRPTWQTGARVGRPRSEEFGRRFPWSARTEDAFRLFGEGFEARRSEPDRAPVRNMEARSLETLGLDREATAAEVKARYKLLVKRHHPDANGGDRSLEDRLRQIIQAYSYLKSVGFC